MEFCDLEEIFEAEEVGLVFVVQHFMKDGLLFDEYLGVVGRHAALGHCRVC